MSESQVEMNLDDALEANKIEQAKLIEQIKARDAEKRTAALAPVLAAIKQHGFTAIELGFARAPAPKREPGAPKVERASVTLAAKYRDEATGDEWAGRGKMPRWLNAHIDAGRDASEFLVAKTASPAPVPADVKSGDGAPPAGNDDTSEDDDQIRRDLAA